MADISLPQFRDFELIGEGGGADVYRAVRVSTGGHVAIKAFLSTLDAATVARRANREVGALVSLKGHPNIIQIEEVLQVDDAVYIVMEYAPGGSLADKIKAERRIAPETVQSVGAQIASALAAAHSKSIIHRDVKPQNILFGLYGTAKLCDFGIASLMLGGQASHTSAISIRYASPEELDGAVLTSATDVYSLGATLLHAYVGRPADLNERLAGIDPLVADAPPVLRLVIGRCLRLDPTDRPTAEEVHALLGGTGQDTQPAPRLAPPPPPPPPRPPADAVAAPAPARPTSSSPRGAIDGNTVSVLFDRSNESPPAPTTQRSNRRLLYVLAVVAVIVIAAVVGYSVASADDGGDPSTTTSVTTSASGPSGSAPS